MRRGLHLATASAAALFSVAGLAFVLVDGTNAASNGRFTHRGTVVRVVDGDTVDVRLTSGKRERVRLIGIDATERGACFSAQASARARALVLNRKVVLRGDSTQDTRDRYGRLLAYVWVSGRDLGYQLLAGGFAKVYVYRDVFERHSAYARAEQGAKASPRGLWRQCETRTTAPQPIAPPPAPPAGGSCHSSYTPCLPIVGDLDCADVRALGQAPVRVLGSDPYRLDGDDDGWGCE
jgi:endonuclease YncB( thermonuclease family)